MPLSAELEKLLETITDPAAREATRKELNDGYLRQADYSRNMNKLADDRKAHEAEHAKNVVWFNKANEQYLKGQKEIDSARERLAELERLKAAAAAGDEDLTPYEEEKLAKELKAARADAEAAKSEMAKLQTALQSINEKLDKQVLTQQQYEEDIQRRGDGLGNAVLDIVDYRDKYREEFGKRLDRTLFMEEARKRNWNLESAYEAMTQKDREEKLRKDVEAEFDKKYQERLKAANLPIEQSGGEPVLGPLQTRLQKKDTAVPEDVAADGSGRLAHYAAQELKQEGKF